ncbi:MAG: NAD-dependent DNA ligase [Candidatus Lokiarchaeum sp. GC14_75]|nr:MAG: NAD-dependent DNA ligase [Candidatus Lokiarchaeum sp. GC14_75]
MGGKMSERPNNVEERIIYLVKEVERHRHLYYNGQPEISDIKYDSLEAELKDLDPVNPILFKIGVDHSELFTKREHIIPMTSQDKVTNPQDFTAWARKRNIKRFLVQFKLDGISIELQYEKGIFKHAVTRGDGKIGDDVSINVIKMKGFIPKLIDMFSGAVRAEVLLFHDIFDKKHSDKQNCRNAAAGLVRRKDGVGCGDLNLIFYDAISLTDNVVFASEVKKLKWLKNQNFPTIKTKVVHKPQEVIKVREDIFNIRSTLEYGIDGLVIKGNDIDTEDMQRAKPMKQVAFKFQAEEIKTKLLDVQWSISGHNYTPVAIVEKVNLAGSNVSRASLANPNLIEELGIKIGSEVVISKRGDIIPKIERVIKTPSDAREISVPQICEECNTTLINEGTRLFCPNEDCPKRIYYRLARWIKKLNVKHFSEKLMLKPLFKTGKVRKIADLYKLEIKDLVLFEGVKETSAKKALDNLNAVKEVSLAKFIGGFAIENIGEDLTQRIVDAGFNTLDKIKNTSIHQLSQVEGFARKTAQQLLEGVIKLYPHMEELLNTNKIKIQEKSQGKKLKGLSFCFTGKLNTIKRAAAEKLVKDLGGQPKSSVVSNLTYLVTNSTDPSAKFLKAQNQDNTQIITEEEFIKMVKS